MRFILNATLLFLLLNDALAACGSPELASNAPPELALNPQIPKTFIYEKGWAIPGLLGASVVRQYRDESGSEVTDYKATQMAYVDLQGFELSTDGKSLRLVPGYAQWVGTIAEYRVQGRTYAYNVYTVSTAKAVPPMWPQIQTPTPAKRKRGASAGVLGCGFTTLRYFDADGDGTFESLEYVGFGGPYSNSTRCPTVPEWALNLLPNRAAAERCSNEQRKIFEIPSSLNELLHAQPILPVLAPGRKD